MYTIPYTKTTNNGPVTSVYGNIYDLLGSVIFRSVLMYNIVEGQSSDIKEIKFVTRGLIYSGKDNEWDP